jgi:hypothetical protein
MSSERITTKESAKNLLRYQVTRYAHFTAEHLAPFADRLCASRELVDSMGRANGTFTAQP